MNIQKGIIYFQMLSAIPLSILIAVRDLNYLFPAIVMFCLGVNGFLLAHEKYYTYK